MHKVIEFMKLPTGLLRVVIYFSTSRGLWWATIFVNASLKWDQVDNYFIEKYSTHWLKQNLCHFF